MYVTASKCPFATATNCSPNNYGAASICKILILDFYGLSSAVAKLPDAAASLGTVRHFPGRVALSVRP